MSHYEDLNTTKIALVGFIATVLVCVIILALIVFYHFAMADQYQVKVVDQKAIELDNLITDQRGQLAKYKWIDPEKGVVQIPIQDAMNLVVEQLQKSPTDGTTDKSDKPTANKATTETPPKERSPENHPPAKEGGNEP
jgi:cell division septation protein DedD